MFRTLKVLLTSALVKGLVGQFVAWALGYAFIAGLRALRGICLLYTSDAADE